jgi:hypothetical protein
LRACLFLNNFFPSMAGGDAAGVFYLGRAHGYRAVTASVALDRLLGFGLLAVADTIVLWLDPVPHPGYAVARVALTAVSLLFVGVLGIALIGTGGLPVLMTIASVSVLSSLPIAINGLGLREQLHVLLLGPLGVRREVAVAISLLLFGHLLAASLAGGVLW